MRRLSALIIFCAGSSLNQVAFLDAINRALLHDRLATLHAARRRRDPIRIAQAKDALRELMAHASLSADLFEQAVLALIDPSCAHLPGTRGETVPDRWPEGVAPDVALPTAVNPDTSVS